MPYLFFGGFWHLWMKDYWYPVGGMQALHDRIAKRFIEPGGVLRCNTTVSRISVEQGRAVGVVTSGGRGDPRQQVVYAGDYNRLVGGLLDESFFRPSFVSKIRSARLTESILNVYLGLDKPVEELEPLLRAHHIFYFPSYDAIFPDRELGPGRAPADVGDGQLFRPGEPGLRSARQVDPRAADLQPLRLAGPLGQRQRLARAYRRSTGASRTRSAGISWS